MARVHHYITMIIKHTCVCRKTSSVLLKLGFAVAQSTVPRLTGRSVRSPNGPYSRASRGRRLPCSTEFQQGAEPNGHKITIFIEEAGAAGVITTSQINSSHLARARISEFESYHPSHA